MLVGLERLLGPDVPVEIGEEAPEGEAQGNALGGAERLVEEEDSKHPVDRDEHGENHSGEQRRAIEDGTDRAETDALEHGGCADQQQVVARLAKLELSGFCWDFLCHVI